MTEFRLDRAELQAAFADLGQMAWTEGKTIEIAVDGGSALMLSYDWRKATKVVDAVFESDRLSVRRPAAVVAAARGWPGDWLNDGVKGFLSARDSDADAKLLFGEFPSPLRLDDVKDAYLAAVAEHLAARFRLDVPAWAEHHGTPLKRAYFAGRQGRKAFFIVTAQVVAEIAVSPGFRGSGSGEAAVPDEAGRLHAATPHPTLSPEAG